MILTFLYFSVVILFIKKILMAGYAIRDKKNWPVVSVDTLNNNKIRFHETPSSARSELSELVGKTDLKPTRNFTKDYITGSSPHLGRSHSLIGVARDEREVQIFKKI